MEKAIWANQRWIVWQMLQRFDRINHWQLRQSSRGRIHQNFMNSFDACIFQKRKKDWQLDCIFALLGSACVKATQKNWWNWPQLSISSTFLRINFSCERRISAAFSSYILGFEKNLYKKCTHLTLMKLTADIKIIRCPFPPSFFRGHWFIRKDKKQVNR
jgi:hypothetical protein